jgi:REP element-mobilizing transposase RayT
MYHFVCPAKYRRVVLSEAVDVGLKKICQEIEDRFDITFLEIGTDKYDVHFIVQSVPKLSPSKIIRTIKRITAKKMFERFPDVKEKLWGGPFWSDGYYVSTVGQDSYEQVISNYVKNQGKPIIIKSCNLTPLLF